MLERGDASARWFASLSSAAAACLSAAGNGTPSGSLRLTASLTSTHEPSAPGTDPLIRIRPRSASVDTTLRFWVVTWTSPRWPAIFLPLNTLPGSWRWPVEPCERCDTDTPWVASRPRKFQRFMPPANPLPMVVPVMSTNWPGMKWAADSSTPTSRTFSGATRNSASFFLGSTLALAKVVRCALATFFTLAAPAPSWKAKYPSF